MHNHRPTDRLEYFSDAVLAIAATLLATELPKPETETGLLQAIVKEWPSYAAFAGWEFLDALPPLELKLREKCSLYILTSSLDVGDMAKSQEYAIVSGFIHKPISPEDIKVIVQQVSESHGQ